MKFNKSALLAATEKAIEAELDRIDAIQAQDVVTYEKAKADWLKSKKPKELKAAATLILGRIERGEVVTPHDGKAFEKWSPSNYFHESEPDPERAKKLCNPRIRKLEALRDFLTMVTDDEVSTNGLNESGFRNVGSVLSLAACE